MSCQDFRNYPSHLLASETTLKLPLGYCIQLHFEKQFQLYTVIYAILILSQSRFLIWHCCLCIVQISLRIFQEEINQGSHSVCFFYTNFFIQFFSHSLENVVDICHENKSLEMLALKKSRTTGSPELWK